MELRGTQRATGHHPTGACAARSGERQTVAPERRDNQRVPGPNSPPPFDASTVEMVCRARGEAVRGHQIANLIPVLKVSKDASEARNTKWKRLFNAVAMAQNRQRDGRPLLRLVGEVMQPVRFESPRDVQARGAPRCPNAALPDKRDGRHGSQVALSTAWRT